MPRLFSASGKSGWIAMACRYRLTAASNLPARWSWNASNKACSAAGGAALLPVFDHVAVIPSDSVKELLPNMAARPARVARAAPARGLLRRRNFRMAVVPHDSRALKKILPKPGSLQRPRRRLGRPHAGLIEDQGARVAGED